MEGFFNRSHWGSIMKLIKTINKIKRKFNFVRNKIFTKTSQTIHYLARLAVDKRRKGNPLSRVFRFIFESKKLKKALGANIAFLVTITSIFMPSTSALVQNQEKELISVVAENTTITNHSVRNPLDTFEITQGYQFFHQGIDLNEEIGAPIYPIMSGKVEKIVYSRFSYGNHIVINHGAGFKSLYAHLSKIVVENGEEVDQNTVIGTVGSTGFSTGSHLHFEVYENGKTFNPLTILNQN
jgi:murein DD-endopeptidase MepM/ murein hydrolase activator NlpD